VRLGQRHAELDGPVQERKLPAHPVLDDLVAGIGEGVRRALRPVAVPIDADLGEQTGLLQTCDGVVHRAVGHRHDAIVVTVPHQPDHLVGVHVVLAQQREHHHSQRCEPVHGALHDCSPPRLVIPS
jgi:hypothetical protein